MSSQYSGPFLVRDLSGKSGTQRLERVEMDGNARISGYDESWLQNLLVQNFQTLPIEDIEPAMAEASPVCLELPTCAGNVDLVAVSPQGDLVIVECKLWRNPEARRAVVGQIIDYAKELQRYCYDRFDDAIQKATVPPGIAKSDNLYHRTGAVVPEKLFTDTVSRNLRRGRFLLIIVGDGIHESVEHIVEFLQQHAGLHFTLALIEMAIFRAGSDGFLICPRTLARTVMITRGVVSIMEGRIDIRPVADTDLGRPTTPVPTTISEERLFDMLEENRPGSVDLLRQFIANLGENGATPNFTRTTIVLRAGTAAESVEIARIYVPDPQVWFDFVKKYAEKLGKRKVAIEYCRTLARLVKNEEARNEKLNPKKPDAVPTLPLMDLLERRNAWRDAINVYLSRLNQSEEL